MLSVLCHNEFFSKQVIVLYVFMIFKQWNYTWRSLLRQVFHGVQIGSYHCRKNTQPLFYSAIFATFITWMKHFNVYLKTPIRFKTKLTYFYIFVDQYVTQKKQPLYCRLANHDGFIFTMFAIYHVPAKLNPSWSWILSLVFKNVLYSCRNKDK